MRAAPALQVVVSRFGVWRGGVRSVGGLAVVAAIAWGVWHALTAGGSGAAPFLAGGALATAASVWMVLRLSAVPAFDLHWDGYAWHLGRPSAPAADPIEGDVQVAIDLGSWMLLRFHSSRMAEERSRYWLPLQRRGLEAAWHGLRCAVYSPRPVIVVADADGAP